MNYDFIPKAFNVIQYKLKRNDDVDPSYRNKVYQNRYQGLTQNLINFF